jgi:hypothetical protein
VPAAPIASCAKVESTRVFATGTPEATRHSLHNGFTAYFALSLVTGLFCHHCPRDTSRELDASVGASGPHDFAVRNRRRSSAHAIASIASRTNVRDDRETPLSWDGMAGDKPVIWVEWKAKCFCRGGLDVANRTEFSEKIVVWKNRIVSPPWRANRVQPPDPAPSALLLTSLENTVERADRTELTVCLPLLQAHRRKRPTAATS